MMTKHLSVLLVTASVALAGCQMNKENMGTLIGAAGGAAIGSQFGGGKGQIAATAAGTLLGAIAGGSVGRSLDKADLMYAQRTQQRALESEPDRSVSRWENPNTGHSGTIQPIETYQTSNNTYCREFEQTIYVEGRSETAVGTACRNNDGTWEIVR